MARKKEPEKAANHERWLVSYADFITLLFAVFVTLYAMSQSDKQKVEQVAASYRSAFGITGSANAGKPSITSKVDVAPVPTVKPQPQTPSAPKATKGNNGKTKATHKEFKQMLVSIEKKLLERKASDAVEVTVTPRGLVISLKEAGFFDSGSAAIKNEAVPLLAEIAKVLAPYDNPLSFEGHTDNKPIHSPLFPSNWELSSSRATSIARHFIDQHGFSPEMIAVTGYGEYRPVASNNTDEGRKQNRRVDIVMLGVSSDEVDVETPSEPQPKAPPLPF